VRAFLRRVGICFIAVGGAFLLWKHKPTESDIAWQDTCRLSMLSCEGIDKPTVYEVTGLLQLFALYGYYDNGSSEVNIASGMTKDERHIIMVHEMQHYLQDKHGRFAVQNLIYECINEYEAFEMSDKIALELGAYHMLRLGHLGDYGCFAKDKK